MAGTLTISTLSDGTNSTSSTNCIRGSATAWVNYQGGAISTAGVIRGSYNVSSITVNGTGDYTINYTNALANNTYSISQMSVAASGTSIQTLYDTTTILTTSVRVQNRNLSNSTQNSGWSMLTVFSS